MEINNFRTSRQNTFFYNFWLESVMKGTPLWQKEINVLHVLIPEVIGIFQSTAFVKNEFLMRFIFKELKVLGLNIQNHSTIVP